MIQKISAAMIGTIGFGGYIILIIAGPLGWAYWMWMALHLGSFMMFFFGLLGP